MNSRFEVFNVETGEGLFDWGFSPYDTDSRKVALMRTKGYVRARPEQPLAVRLWEKGNPIPTIVYSPHAL